MFWHLAPLTKRTRRWRNKRRSVRVALAKIRKKKDEETTESLEEHYERHCLKQLFLKVFRRRTAKVNGYYVPRLCGESFSPSRVWILNVRARCDTGETNQKHWANGSSLNLYVNTYEQTMNAVNFAFLMRSVALYVQGTAKCEFGITREKSLHTNIRE